MEPTETATTRVRGEYRKSAQRRQEIIAAALQVFSEAGFRDGSLRDVAERAGITHAGIRHHFPTKVALLQAVLRWRDEEALARDRAHPVGIEVLVEWVAAIEESSTTPHLIELQVTLGAEAVAADHPAHDYFRERYRTVTALLARAFTAMRAAGELAPAVTPTTAAELAVATAEGLQRQWLMDRSIDLVGRVKQHLQLMLSVDLDAAISRRRR